MACFNLSYVLLLLRILSLSLRFAIRPLARFIDRISCSIRRTFEVAIAIFPMVSLFTGLIRMEAMISMHNELHNIQKVDESGPAEVQISPEMIWGQPARPHFHLDPNVEYARCNIGRYLW